MANPFNNFKSWSDIIRERGPQLIPVATMLKDKVLEQATKAVANIPTFGQREHQSNKSLLLAVAQSLAPKGPAQQGLLDFFEQLEVQFPAEADHPKVYAAFLATLSLSLSTGEWPQPIGPNNPAQVS